MDYANPGPGCSPTTGVTHAAKGPVAFSASCFTPAPAVAGGVLVGNSGRNNFYGPGLTTVDFSAFKNFHFTEQFKLQFRAEFFNVLNHTNFQAPHFIATQNNSIGFSKARVISSPPPSPGQIQLDLKP